MASNINHVHQAPTPLPSTTSTQLTPEETSLFQGSKLMRTLITTSLVLLAIGSAATGVVLTVILASPAFLALMVVSVLFAVIACVAYKNLSLQASNEWKSDINSYFKAVPVSVTDWKFHGADGWDIWQNRSQSKIYLALPHDLEKDDQPFSLKLPVTYKTQSMTGVTSKHPMVVNPVDPHTNRLTPNGTSITQALQAQFSTLSKDNADWNKSLEDPSLQPPFGPLEVRTTPLTAHSSLSTMNKSLYPELMTHARPPLLSDFIGPKQKVKDHYYLRLKLLYEAIFESAAREGSDVLSLPLLMAESPESLAAAGFSEQEVTDLSLSALVSSVQKLAGSRQVGEKMLIVVQKKKVLTERNED